MRRWRRREVRRRWRLSANKCFAFSQLRKKAERGGEWEEEGVVGEDLGEGRGEEMWEELGLHMVVLANTNNGQEFANVSGFFTDNPSPTEDCIWSPQKQRRNEHRYIKG